MTETPPPSPYGKERSVRIILECILVVVVVIVTQVFSVLASLPIGLPRMRMNMEGKFSRTSRTKSMVSHDSLLYFSVKCFRNLQAIFSTFKNHLFLLNIQLP